MKKIQVGLKSHDFRASKITNLFNSGIRLEKIKEFVSHKNLATTEHYLKLNKEEIV